MPSVLVCYGTSEGQTAEVAERIVEELLERGYDVTTVGAKQEVDPVLVGASVHFGRHKSGSDGSSAPTATGWRRSRRDSFRCR